MASIIARPKGSSHSSGATSASASAKRALRPSASTSPEVDGVVAEERLDVVGEVLALLGGLHLSREADRQAGPAGGNDRAVGALLVAHPSQPGDVVGDRTSTATT